MIWDEGPRTALHSTMIMPDGFFEKRLRITGSSDYSLVTVKENERSIGLSLVN